jgi:ribonuclease HII
MELPANIQYVVGVDEAGRGPLAGPVAVGAVLMSRAVYEAYLARPEASSRIKKVEVEVRVAVGKDSKKMSPRLREVWHDWLLAERKAGLLNYVVGLSSATNIDRFGIVAAIRLALDGCLTRLAVDPATTLILLDGGLRASKEYLHQETIIQGDENEPIIALASVAAKVERDHRLQELALEYPGYGLEKHKGYGTKDHYIALERLGPCPIHRKSFIK